MAPSPLMLRSLDAENRKDPDNASTLLRAASLSPGPDFSYAAVKKMPMGCRYNAARGVVIMLCCRKDVRWVVRIAAWGII